MTSRSTIAFTALAAAAVGFAAGFAASTATGGHDKGQAAVVTVTQTVMPPPANIASASPAGKPSVVLTDHGNGIKTTRTFTVTGDWDLHYTYTCDGGGLFSVAQDETSGGSVYINETGSHGDDVTHQHASGAMALKVTSDCSWTIKVVQLG